MDASQDNPQAQAERPALDLSLTQRIKDGGKPLYKIRTLDWLPWLVVLTAMGLLIAVEAARHQAGLGGTLKLELWASIIALLVIAAIAWAKMGASKAHLRKFVFPNPDDEIAFVHLDEMGIRYGVPKLQQTQVTWVYFNNYTITVDTLRLIAGGMTMHIDLTRLEPSQLKQLQAGLARVFARPRVGPPIHIRHCMGCGYDLSGSDGPNCPECGRPFHKYNYRGSRATDA